MKHLVPGPVVVGSLTSCLVLLTLAARVASAATPALIAFAGPVSVNAKEVVSEQDMPAGTRLEVGPRGCAALRTAAGTTVHLTWEEGSGRRSILTLRSPAEGHLLGNGTLLFEVLEGDPPLELRSRHLRCRVLVGRGLLRCGPDRDYLGLVEGQLEVWALATGSGYKLRAGHAAWFDAGAARPRPDHFGWGASRACVDSMSERAPGSGPEESPGFAGPVEAPSRQAGRFKWLLGLVRSFLLDLKSRLQGPIDRLAPRVRLAVLVLAALACAAFFHRYPGMGYPAVLLATTGLEAGAGVSRQWVSPAAGALPGGALLIGGLMILWYRLARGPWVDGPPAHLPLLRWVLPRLAVLWLVGSLGELGMPGVTPATLLRGPRTGLDPTRALAGLSAWPPLVVELLALVLPLLVTGLLAPRTETGPGCEYCGRQLRSHQRRYPVEPAEEAAIRSGGKTSGVAGLCSSVRNVSSGRRRPDLPVLRISFSFCPLCAIGTVSLESDRPTSRLRVRGERQIRDLLSLPS